MLKAVIMSPSISGRSFPVIIVYEKYWTEWVCVYDRLHNNFMKLDKWPPQLIEEMLD